MPAKKAAASKTAAKKPAAPARKAAVPRPPVAKKAAGKTAGKTAKKAAKKVARKSPAAAAAAAPTKTARAGGAGKAPPVLTDGQRLAVAAARLAEDIKAEDIVVLDVSAVSSITDYFVICSGSSAPHLKAIAREVRSGMAENEGVRPAMAEGDHESQWVVLDYGIMMVHAFHPEKRDLYALEDLWGDARLVDWRA
jgi:ribosome-associated protein